jgi:hypothetical protein
LTGASNYTAAQKQKQKTISVTPPMSEIFVCSGKVFDFMSLLYRRKTMFQE